MELTIKEWAAWAPSLETPTDFDAWAQGTADWGTDGVADVSFLPAKFRRRLTPLSKMGLAVAYGCLVKAKFPPEDLRSVFSSRYGEHNLTVQILREISQDEGVSPMRFAMSVHNSTSGLFSIGSGNKESTTAITGGKDTFFYALLEAASLLHHDPSSPVLVVMCEEPLDPIYHSFVDEQQTPYAVAFLVAANGAGKRLSFTLSGNDPAAQEALVPANEMPRAMSFLRWWLTAHEPDWTSRTGKRVWSCRKKPAAESTSASTRNSKATTT
jgi:hypothetical protein